jgi:diguanylate cyclase (GGDEF)-like protein/PAS domain S-box-containing protein
LIDAAEATASTSSASGAAILIVDDDSAKRLSIKSILEPLGHSVIEAVSGEAALHEVIKQPFAVILMDVQMPIMDGYETAKLIRMRSACAHTPIIFITAHEQDEAQIPIAYASGAVDFIFGTVVPDVLRAKVSIFVELFLKSRELERSLGRVTTLSDQFRDNEARTRAVLENVADGIVTITDDGIIESFNRAATGLFGYGEREAIGQHLSVMVAPLFSSAAPGEIAGAIEIVAGQQNGSDPTDTLGRRKDGSTFPLELELTGLQLGARKLRIVCLRDISERQRYTATLQHQAVHDDLTGLPNRVLFGDRVSQAIQAAQRTGEPLALLVMDLDEFKHVNDTLGHQHGDILLKLVADRLVECLRTGDTVARLGGDEFGILPLGATDLAGAATVAWKIQQALKPIFLVKGHNVEVKTSIGITLVPEHGDNIDDLLRRADMAMYDAKRSGGGYATFATAHEESTARRLALLGDLRQCITNNELVLHYQPKIDLRTLQTIGVEALIRWNHPSGRLLMPDQFIPEVEASELMVPITEWVINEALRQLRRWRDEGYDLTMAVNLGARCLAQGTSLFETVEELTTAWRIPADMLTFELTESALLDTAVPGLLAGLENMNEHLSIDDFGTGYSSLVYLQRLPVVEIKADKSFVTGMTHTRDDAVIVRAIIDLAHNLSAKIVAEGVEDEETMKLLIDYGCDAAQGYYFSRPVPGDDLLQWFEASSFGLSPGSRLEPARARRAPGTFERGLS